MVTQQMGVKSAPKPSDHHISRDQLSASKEWKGKEVVMNLMKRFQFPNKKTTTCGISKPIPHKVQNYWDKACDQNPAKSGCKIYES